MKIFKSFATCSLLAAAIMFAAAGCKTAEHSGSASASAGVKAYPLKTCIVTDEPLEAGKQYTFVRDGQELKLCCKSCLADFDKDPKKYMAKLNAAK